VARQQIRALAPYMPFSRRVALANLWLFAPVIARAFADRPAMNASMRTTLAPTILAAGDKDNVLPASARAVVNSRILPGETMQSVLAHVRASIGDARVTVRPIERGAHDPPELSPYDERSEAGIGARGYRDIEAAIGHAFPDAVIVPALVLGATDGRHYRPLSGGVYRWAPFRLQEQDLARLHGRDERVKIADLPVAVRAYMELMRRAEK
jgi:carboxypeptidase PM20D1